ncbi:MAG: HU family DNA-binding protein [Thermoflexales bacterium]|nr:HU family DNA-binding protein [Thermoflexales bacterium]
MADKKQLTKSQVVGAIAEKTELTKVQVNAVLDALGELMVKELSTRGPMAFTLPGVMKATSKKKPATKAGTKPNPFKPGEMMTVKAKPASMKVTARFLKGMKDAIK